MGPDGTPYAMLLSDAAGDSAAELERWVRDVLPSVASAARPRSIVVQLRHKALPFDERRRWAERLRAETAAYGQLLVVNGSWEMADAVDADGVHLPEGSPPSAWVRAHCRPGLWITRAWHRTRLPAEERPDAWVLSPVCAPRKGRPPLGLGGLEQAARSAPGGAAPQVIALGGVEAEHARACVDAGAAGVAVLGAARSVGSALELLDALGLRAGPCSPGPCSPGPGQR